LQLLWHRRLAVTLQIPKDTMMLAANSLPCSIRRKSKRQNQLVQTDRGATTFCGDMGCLGAYIDPAVLLAILKPLVTRRGPRRAASAAGQIDTGGRNFPRNSWWNGSKQDLRKDHAPLCLAMACLGCGMSSATY
jgi:hypothetical protein